MLSEREKELLIDDIRIYIQADELIKGTDDYRAVESYTEDGMAYLDRFTGVSLDYSKGTARALLKDYVRYRWNKASELFPVNFDIDLSILQWEAAADDFAQKQAKPAPEPEL